MSIALTHLALSLPDDVFREIFSHDDSNKEGLQEMRDGIVSLSNLEELKGHI